MIIKGKEQKYVENHYIRFKEYYIPNSDIIKSMKILVWNVRHAKGIRLKELGVMLSPRLLCLIFFCNVKGL